MRSPMHKGAPDLIREPAPDAIREPAPDLIRGLDGRGVPGGSGSRVRPGTPWRGVVEVPGQARDGEEH
jgi:hypothetical protein